MKRTQLYLDEEMARMLEALSRQQGTTISELVRNSVRASYLQGQPLDRSALARELCGIWRDRKRWKDIEDAVRKLRAGRRIMRLHHV